MIRLAIPSIDEDDLQAVREVLASGYLVQGRWVRDFEQKVAGLTGMRHAIAVSNGTAALHLALLALDVRPGDLVAVTAYSWIATANVIELCGAQPVFVDIEPDTFNMDPLALEAALKRLAASKETVARLKVILPIHAFGQLANMPEILKIAGRYGLPVVEDAACALGAKLDGKQAGSWATLGTFSFHPRKAITTGEGGMITTNDDELAWKMRALRNHGLDPAAPAPDFVMPGFNYRMTDFQGALGSNQMQKLDRLVAVRRSLAANYGKLLEGAPVTPPAVAHNSDPVYQSYVCLLPQEAAAARTNLIQKLKQEEIETTIGTWHMPMSSYFRARYHFRPGDFPATDGVFARSLSLPLYEGLTAAAQERVVGALLKQLDRM
jgi:perosamine synthetase